MNSNFFSLSKITDQHIVQKILDAWFSKRIQLFLYFGGNGKKCRLSRCISPSLHIGGEQLISNGDEFYLSEDSNAHSILKFIPDLPLKSNLKITKGFKISRSIQGEYYNYEYAGTALGYWVVVPTKIAAFNNGNYILTDKESFSLKADSSGAVYVYSVYDEDYLIFDGDNSINNNDLYIDINVLNSVFPSFNPEDDFNSVTVDKKVHCEMFETKKENFALCLLMHETVVRNNGVPVVSKFKVDYDKMWDAKISESTLLEWFEKPGAFTDKRQRITNEKRKGLYLFIELFSQKYVSNSRTKAPVITDKLNKLAASDDFQFPVAFTTSDVRKWLKKPQN